jgi:hypothetical protein
MAVDQFNAAATAAEVLRSQKELARKGFAADCLPAERLKGGYVLTELLRCECGARDGRHVLARAPLLPMQDAVWPTHGSG